MVEGPKLHLQFDGGRELVKQQYKVENRKWFKGAVLGRHLEGGWNVAEGEVSKIVSDFSTTSSANGDNNKHRLGMATPVEEVFTGSRNSCSCKFYGGYTGFGSTNAAKTLGLWEGS